MKCYNKSILLIACMLFFLLIGVVSANKNDTISNVSIEDNTLEVGIVNQSCDLNSQQNNNNDIVDYSDNSSSKTNIENEFSNSSNNNGDSFYDLDDLLNFTNNTLYSGYDILLMLILLITLNKLLVISLILRQDLGKLFLI